MFSHRFSRPSRQRVQWPHQRDGLTATWSPILRPVTPEPNSTISPATSWPSTSGEVTTKSRVPEVVHVGAADAAGAEPDADHAGFQGPELAFDHPQVFRPEKRCGQCSI